MASNTQNLSLYKKDPVADANDTFNIQTMMNDNWDLIDAFAGATESSLSGKARIEIGTYSGTGTNSKTLTASFPPKLVIIYGSDTGYKYSDILIYISGQPRARTIWTGYNAGINSNFYVPGTAAVTESGNDITFKSFSYDTNLGNSIDQNNSPSINESGKKYGYAIIGY